MAVPKMKVGASSRNAVIGVGIKYASVWFSF